MDIGFMLGKFLEANPDALMTEADRLKLVNQVDQARYKRSLQYNSKLLKVKVPNIMYITRAQSASSSATSGKGVHMQVVHPVGMKSGMSLNDLRKLLTYGDLEVWCNCPDFNYNGFYYILGRERPTASLTPDDVKPLTGVYDFKPRRVKFAPPKIRNPNMEGSVCKHLYSVLAILHTHATTIHGQLSSGKGRDEKESDEKKSNEKEDKPKSGTSSSEETSGEESE